MLQIGLGLHYWVFHLFLEEAEVVVAFDEAIAEHLKGFLSASAKIGGLVHQQAQLFEKAVKAQRAYIVMASKSRKTADQVMSSPHLCSLG